MPYGAYFGILVSCRSFSLHSVIDPYDRGLECGRRSIRYCACYVCSVHLWFHHGFYEDQRKSYIDKPLLFKPRSF